MSRRDEDDGSAGTGWSFDVASPLRFGDTVVEHDFPRDVLVGGDIGAAARRQPELFVHYGQLAVEARHRVRVLRSELARVEAGIEYEIRNRLQAAHLMAAKASDGSKRPAAPKVSVSQIKATVRADERYIRKESMVHEAERLADQLTVWEEALRQRAMAIAVLAEEG